MKEDSHPDLSLLLRKRVLFDHAQHRELGIGGVPEIAAASLRSSGGPFHFSLSSGVRIRK